MKAFLNRFLAKLFLLSLTVMLCFQNTALAGPLGDRGGDGLIRSLPSRARIFWETLKPSVAQAPGHGEGNKGNGGSAGRDRQGAGGGDAGQRERNKESGHRGHGGPL
jgi:hypothetical protein